MTIVLGATIGMGVFLMVKAETGRDLLQGLGVSIVAGVLLLHLVT